MTFYDIPRSEVSSCLPPLSDIEEDGGKLRNAILMLEDLRDSVETMSKEMRATYPMFPKAAELLYAVMDFAPLTSARERVADDILLCKARNTTQEAIHEDLLQLATYYADHLLRPFRTRRVRTPPVSTPASPSFVDYFRLTEIAETPTPGNNERIEARARSMKRDGRHCVASGILHYSYKIRIRNETNEACLPTAAAYIIPFHLVSLKGTDSEAKTPHSAFWQIVEWFCNIKYEGFNDMKMNRLDNILTLTWGVHDAFDNLDMWFEEMPGHAHRYKVEFLDPGYRCGLWAKDEVEFKNHDPSNLPLPNPLYLRLHAACAKISHMSGVGVLMDEWDEEIEEMCVLASDGTSMPLLASRLTALSE